MEVWQTSLKWRHFFYHLVCKTEYRDWLNIDKFDYWDTLFNSKIILQLPTKIVHSKLQTNSQTIVEATKNPFRKILSSPEMLKREKSLDKKKKKKRLQGVELIINATQTEYGNSRNAGLRSRRRPSKETRKKERKKEKNPFATHSTLEKNLTQSLSLNSPSLPFPKEKFY